jgi:hypothetical protein
MRTRTPVDDSPAVKELRAAIRVARERLRDADTYQTIRAAEIALASLERSLMDTLSMESAPKKQRRGFARLSADQRRAVAKKGGQRAHEEGKAHEWTRDEAQAAGAKGGAISRGGRGKLPADPGVASRSAAVDAAAESVSRSADAGGSDDGEPRP